MPRMDTMEYADRVVNDIISRNSDGRFWCGTHAEQTKPASPVPQAVIVSYFTTQSIMQSLMLTFFDTG